MRIKSSHRTVATAITEMTCGLLVFVTRERNYQETVKKTFVRVLRFSSSVNTCILSIEDILSYWSIGMMTGY